MASGHAFQPDLVKRIHDTIHVGLSVRHVPSLILETKGIPYTLNGKKVEVAIKQIITGKAVEQRGAFSNPEALHLYWDIPELQGFGVRLAGTGRMETLSGLVQESLACRQAVLEDCWWELAPERRHLKREVVGAHASPRLGWRELQFW
ncbi:PREDICTED: acetoacetyl-CoA synthetase-like isoform X2 [Cercocebus atys]|uniref:acetoacetyl-CoA synthetase-like isoform X2 n=1 Tax=Cercocebus atys TaxID=9531 RepID=UPI0005F53794|nr:PREDICTED: acetoacetyl-CoA synthetase-like isoform X2 [Cercocebus atys]